MKLVHAADIHLDSPLRGLDRYDGAPSADLRVATRRAFVNLVDHCLEERVDALLLAGDVYDGDWQDFNTGLFFVKQLARLREAGIRVWAVLGNHDAASVITRRLKLPENVTLLSHDAPQTSVDERLGLAVHGQSFAKRDVGEDLAAAYPRALPGLLNVGLLHTALAGRPEHAPYAPTTSDRLASKGYAYWALGHVHRAEVVSRDPWIVFPGNLQGRSVRETGEKGFVVVTAEGTEVRSVEPVAADVARWHDLSVDVSPARNPDDAATLVQRALEAAAGASAGRSGWRRSSSGRFPRSTSRRRGSGRTRSGTWPAPSTTPPATSSSESPRKRPTTSCTRTTPSGSECRSSIVIGGPGPHPSLTAGMSFIVNPKG